MKTVLAVVFLVLDTLYIIALLWPLKFELQKLLDRDAFEKIAAMQDENHAQHKSYMALNETYWWLTFIGLITNNWVFFLPIILCSIISRIVSSNNKTWFYVDSAICALALIWIVINHFHFEYYPFT